MADGKIPPVFQKGGNVSRSPIKDINQRAIELARLRRVLEAEPYDPLAVLNDTHHQFIRETLIKQVAAYIDETLELEEEPLRPEKVLSVVSSKLQELEEDAEQGRQNDNAGDNGGNAGAADGTPQPAEGDGNGATEPQQVGGGSNADANAPLSELCKTSWRS
jgi:hypothetical protein